VTSPSSSTGPEALAGAGLYAALEACLRECDPAAKLAQVAWLAQHADRLDAQLPDVAAARVEIPGRPSQPVLVAPRDVAQRGLGTPAGRAAFLHAIAHIEFNAINLALDAAWRFRDLPPQFAQDWISVAADEARHFAMLQARLASLGHGYGDFPAHDGLWEMALKTDASVLARMALVPRVLEARGLDVTPGIITRLRGLGDAESIAVLELILAEEVRHVAIGSQWYAWCCEREGCEPRATFLALLRGQAKGSLRGPFNRQARLAAGFDEDELAGLARLAEEGA
jgi:uncharacterized ferritin-like protein (DUF455 family)